MNVYTRFYNILADLIRWVEDNTEEDFFIKYRGISRAYVMKMNRALGALFPELIQQETYQTLEIVDDDRWDDVFFERLIDFIDKCKEDKKSRNNKGDVLVQLIHKLDKGLSERILAGEDYLNISKPVNCLNTNWNETQIMLLPRCRCLWERNSQGKQYGSGLMNDMKSMYYIRTEDLKGYELRNVFLGKTFFSYRKNLRIGVSPITNKDVLKVSYYEKENSVYFSVNGLRKPSNIRSRMRNILQKARDAGVDIMLFPEMLGMEVLIEDYRGMYEDDWDGKYPELLLFPSIWNAHSNTCVVTEMDGTELGRQQKQNPFLYDLGKQEKAKMRELATEAIEGLEPDKTIWLFHIEGIGRMAVMICMDFLERNYRRILLDVLKGTFLMVPSFSTGCFDFENVMKECCQYDCSVVWGNCCSAMNLENAKRENFNNIGFIQFSGKLTDSVGKISIEEKNRCNKKSCKKDCLFINDIPLEADGTTRERREFYVAEKDLL